MDGQKSAEEQLEGPAPGPNPRVDKFLQHADDADEAMKVFAERGDASLELDSATFKQLLRTIDWHLIPMMSIVYGLNYLDKTSLSYASVMGLQEDLHLQGSQYSWLGSVFYFGYLVWEYPTSWLLQRFPIGKYSALNVILWGVVLSCFAAVHNFSGALAVRFFLGLFEAAVTPGFALITSQWYTKREQGLRTSIWFSFNGFAQVFGGLLAYGISIGVRRLGAAIPGWRIIFLALGLVTASVGVILWFAMPDSQLNAWFLKEDDRVLAVERIRENRQGVGNKHWKRYQFKEAFLDPQGWMFFFYGLIANIPNGGITNFFSLLIVSFGYTPEESLLYGTPGGAVQVGFTLIWGILTYYFHNRILFGAASLSIALLGAVLLIALPTENTQGRLAGYYLTMASAPPFIALISLVSTNVAGYTKKTTLAATLLIAYCAGNIIGPQTFQAKDAPGGYVPAQITIIVCWSICLLLLGAIYVHYRVMNTRKRKLREESGYIKLENQEFLDLTDRENPEFEYVL